MNKDSALEALSPELQHKALLSLENLDTLPIIDQLGRSQDLKILPEYPPNSHVSHPQLSPTENGRLQRAFCRIELYRRLFAQCSHNIPDGIQIYLKDAPLTPAEQAGRFLQALPILQIAEIVCIRDYLFRRLKGICDELENEAVRTLPLKAMTFKRHGKVSRWRSQLYLFTIQAQLDQLCQLEHLVSLGISYIRKIIESTGEEQRNVFLHYEYTSVRRHFEPEFLSTALRGLEPHFS